MKGIVGHAIRIPAYRIAREEIARAWQTSSAAGHKRAVRFDEDALTLAAAAALDCRSSLGGAEIDGLFLASTTAPYLERSNASLIAALCDLPEKCSTLDLAASLRGGTSGLRLALTGLNSGSSATIICAGECREAEPGSAEEMLYSDGGAAIAAGTQNVIAELIADATAYDDFFDAVRRDRDLHVTSFASKFSIDRGYIAPITKVVGDVLRQAGKSAKDIAKLAVPSPDRRAHQQLARKLGFNEAQLQDIQFDDGGITGTAMPLALLSIALESAKPGDLLLVAGYGNGADAMLFRATDYITSYKLHSPSSVQKAVAIDYKSYTMYRRAREFFRSADQGLEISNIFYAKEEPQIVRLHGSACRHCGTRQFPVAQVCVGCKKGDGLEEAALARTGTIYTFSVDTLYPSPFPPTVMAVVELDGGARIYCEVVDVAPSEVKIGMSVELTLRKLKEGGGLYHYYWKCSPRRGK
ncbi:MAG: OB-fold domain-containing protein [Terriglobales bacterium]